MRYLVGPCYLFYLPNSQGVVSLLKIRLMFHSCQLLSQSGRSEPRFLNTIPGSGVAIVSQQVMNPTRVHEDVRGFDPWPRPVG